MVSLTSYRIISIDLSYSSPGFAVLDISNGDICVEYVHNPKNPVILKGFDGMFAAMRSINNNIIELIERLLKSSRKKTVLIFEVPYFSQQAKGAACMGLCWGIVGRYPQALAVSPDAIKMWSESKRGDKKAAVKKKVLERVPLGTNLHSNDDILDAVANGLMFYDTVGELNYAHAKANQ